MVTEDGFTEGAGGALALRTAHMDHIQAVHISLLFFFNISF